MIDLRLLNSLTTVFVHSRTVLLNCRFGILLLERQIFPVISLHLTSFPLQNDFHLETELLLSLLSSIHPSIVSFFHRCILPSFPYPLILHVYLILLLFSGYWHAEAVLAFRFLHNPKHFRKNN